MNTLNTRKTILSLAVMLALASGVAMGVENDLNVGGSGTNTNSTDQSQSTGSAISIYQVGGSNQVGLASGSTVTTYVTQAGLGNKLIIGQFAPSATPSDTVIPATGTGAWTATGANIVTGNSVLGSQSGGGSATVLQTTDGNAATISQAGAAHTMAIYQTGSTASTAVATQVGTYANNLTLYQKGGSTTDGTNLNSVTDGTAKNGIYQDGTSGVQNAVIQQSGGSLDVIQSGGGSGANNLNIGTGTSSGLTRVFTATSTSTSALPTAGGGLESGNLIVRQTGSSDTANIYDVNADGSTIHTCGTGSSACQTGTVIVAQSGTDSQLNLQHGTTSAIDYGNATITMSGDHLTANLIGDATGVMTTYVANLTQSGTGTGAGHTTVNARY